MVNMVNTRTMARMETMAVTTDPTTVRTMVRIMDMVSPVVTMKYPVSWILHGHLITSSNMKNTNRLPC